MSGLKCKASGPDITAERRLSVLGWVTVSGFPPRLLNTSSEDEKIDADGLVCSSAISLVPRMVPVLTRSRETPERAESPRRLADESGIVILRPMPFLHFNATAETRYRAALLVPEIPRQNPMQHDPTCRTIPLPGRPPCPPVFAWRSLGRLSPWIVEPARLNRAHLSTWLWRLRTVTEGDQWKICKSAALCAVQAGPPRI